MVLPLWSHEELLQTVQAVMMKHTVFTQQTLDVSALSAAFLSIVSIYLPYKLSASF